MQTQTNQTEQWPIQKFLKGKTIYQLRPHLLQMRTTNYMPFTRKNGFLNKNMSQYGRGGRPSFESATGTASLHWAVKTTINIFLNVDNVRQYCNTV